MKVGFELSKILKLDEDDPSLLTSLAVYQKQIKSLEEHNIYVFVCLRLFW